MTKHARYGGSTISRTLNCHGWRQFVDTLPDIDDSSDDADVGILLHGGMERIYSMESIVTAREIIGMTYKGHTLTEELYEAKIVPALEAVEEIFDRYGITEFELESLVKLFENSWGTADLIGLGEVPADKFSAEQLAVWGIDADLEPELPIRFGLSLDYKFGDGVIVEAEENDQGLFYATAGSMTPEVQELFEDLDVLLIAIVQPASRLTTTYTVWETTPDCMDQMMTDVGEAIVLCEGEDPETVAGDWCRFCPGRGLCSATNGELMAALRLDLKAPELLSRIPTFEQLDRVKATVKAIEKLVHAQIEAGAKIPGYKLVAKRASRSYSDLEAAEGIAKRSRKLKKDESYDYELKSPPQMEILCKKKGLDFGKLFGDVVQKVSSGTTLASESDERNAIPGMAELASLLDRD